MGTAVLRSQDCLRERLHLEAFGSRPPPLTKPHRKKPPPPSAPPPTKPGRGCPPPQAKAKAKAAPPPLRRKPSSPVKEARRVLVMEEVKILKRGEVLKPVASPPVDLVVCPTSRLGPDPDNLPRKLGLFDREPVYAGPGFIVSPSPSSLPLPNFFLKKAGVVGR